MQLAAGHDALCSFLVQQQCDGQQQPHTSSTSIHSYGSLFPHYYSYKGAWATRPAKGFEGGISSDPFIGRATVKKLLRFSLQPLDL
jgi:hypothetical protein